MFDVCCTRRYIPGQRWSENQGRDTSWHHSSICHRILAKNKNIIAENWTYAHPWYQRSARIIHFRACKDKSYWTYSGVNLIDSKAGVQIRDGGDRGANLRFCVDIKVGEEREFLIPKTKFVLSRHSLLWHYWRRRSSTWHQSKMTLRLGNTHR